jgi:hypothetical protein
MILFMVVSASLSFSQYSVASENCKSQGDFNNSRINVGATCKQPTERGSGGSKEPPKLFRITSIFVMLAQKGVRPSIVRLDRYLLRV